MEPSLSGSLPHPDNRACTVTCAILTVSDTRTPTTDRSGQLMTDQLVAAGHCIVHYQIIPDEPEQITSLVKGLCARVDIQVILLNGGTGIAPRDTTYDAIVPLLTKELPGFGEIFRQLSYAEIGSRAIASRAVAGICTAPHPVNSHGADIHENKPQSTLIFSLPGSRKAVKLALETLIMPELIHLTSLLS